MTAAARRRLQARPTAEITLIPFGAGGFHMAPADYPSRLDVIPAFPDTSTPALLRPSAFEGLSPGAGPSNFQTAAPLITRQIRACEPPLSLEHSGRANGHLRLMVGGDMWPCRF